MMVVVMFFFLWLGDQQKLHRVGRRQRQMVIRDSLVIVLNLFVAVLRIMQLNIIF